jgi:hypothetical protein
MSLDLPIVHDLLHQQGRVRPFFGRSAFLGSYLVTHPARLKDLWRLVPESSAGIDATWSLSHGRLVLTRLAVRGFEDPLLELVLWHALFPGLRPGFTCWWASGRFRVIDANRVPTLRKGPAGHSDAFPQNGLLELDHGRLLPPGTWKEEAPRWQDRDLLEWPWLIRLLLLPVVVALYIPGVVNCLVQERRRMHLPMLSWWRVVPMVLLMPVFAFVWILPTTLGLRLTDWFQLRFEVFHRGTAVKELVQEAFASGTRRTVRGDQE